MNTLVRPRVEISLRAALALAAVAIAYTGLDNALGGVATIGLQGPTDFFSVADADAFAVRDSHVRFLGGVWLGVGLIFLCGAIWLRPLRSAVTAAGLLAFAGGLARFSSMTPAEIFSHGLGGPLAAELLVLPLLGVWAWRSGSNAHLTSDQTVLVDIAAPSR